MIDAVRLTDGASVPFHPVSHYNSPAAVLSDDRLSAAEKRVILSSWASDMYAVESNPALREVPGIPSPMRLSDILAALRELDGEDDPPPRGGAAMRLTRLTTLDAVARRSATHGAFSRAKATVRSRWSREANVERYRRLLGTQLTDHERRFVERRLAEELATAGRSRRTPGRVAP
ncbi:MAG: hypothetical protein JO052_10000 [Bradyrhizobium sp.]|nr:hypothetical protein [Bradyrhizobium sp.]